MVAGAKVAEESDPAAEGVTAVGITGAETSILLCSAPIFAYDIAVMEERRGKSKGGREGGGGGPRTGDRQRERERDMREYPECAGGRGVEDYQEEKNDMKKGIILLRVRFED